MNLSACHYALDSCACLKIKVEEFGAKKSNFMKIAYNFEYIWFENSLFFELVHINGNLFLLNNLRYSNKSL